MSLVELRGPGQRPAVARARALVAARALEEGGVSIAQTARYFGRDASTLAKGVARVPAEEE